MELHVPHGSIRSIKDFLVHIGIVTVGVIVALGLSQLVEAYHRSRMAAQTLRKASWDTAIATQIVGALPPDKVRGYELAYEELTTFVDEERIGVGYWYDLKKYGENPAALSTEDRRALIQELRRYKAFAWFLEAIGTDALKMCASTLN